ncbi:MAG: BCCT family transporter [Pseudomonadota bacterium]
MVIDPQTLAQQTIQRVADGFYSGFNRPVALGAMTVVGALIIWILVLPENATAILSWGKDATLLVFRAWYVYALAALVAFCLFIVCLPVSGRLRLGPDDEEPEYSTFSWLSMMFCAGIGAGVLIYAVAEPLAHFQANPDILSNAIEAQNNDAAVRALSFTYLHWGLSAWSCYAVLALAIALYSHRYGMPLTIRTALAPVLGRHYDGWVGNLIDIFSIVAIITGVATTLGYGVAQLVSGLSDVTGAEIFTYADGEPTTAWQLAALVVSAVVATGSVVSGVARGIKWLSNFSIALFFAVMVAFAAFGDATMAGSRYGLALWTYVSDFPVNATRVASAHTPVAEWQTGWTIFYWAWWIAFAPFVSMFLARVSKGRSLRAFIVGCLFMPVIVCTVWFAFVGGAALEWQLGSSDINDLAAYPISAQIYETFRVTAGVEIASFGNIFVALLMLMLLITTLNAAILAINTIAAGGDEGHHIGSHISIWGAAVTMIIGGLILAGGTQSIRDAMIIGALPFSFVIALSIISVCLSLFYERRKDGISNN